MSIAKNIESFLVADCGTRFTKVCLFDVVNDIHRFIASETLNTTIGEADSDVTKGIFGCIAKIQSLTGRQLLLDNEIITPQSSSGDGVDAFFNWPNKYPTYLQIFQVLPHLPGLTTN